MTFHIALDALAGALLVLIAMKVKTHNLLSFLVFKAAAMTVGLPLCFLAFGQFMGWPV